MQANLSSAKHELSPDTLLLALAPLLAGLSPIAASLIRGLLRLIFGVRFKHSLTDISGQEAVLAAAAVPDPEDMLRIVQLYDELLSKVRAERSPEEYEQCVRALAGIRTVLLETGGTYGN